MTETFITAIQVNQSRNIRDFLIPISETERKHLIITGKNGSGKTSLLDSVNDFFRQIENGNYTQYKHKLEILNDLIESKKQLSQKMGDERLGFERLENVTELRRIEGKIEEIKEWQQVLGGTIINFNKPEAITQKVLSGEYLITFFDAKRHVDLNVPSGINKIEIKKKYHLQEKANQNFIQYIVNLKADRSFAKDDGEIDVVNRIDSWFARFEKSLREIFDSDSLQLKFDRSNYNFDIIQEGKLPFNFNTLSSGYSAIISIVTELILRMEAHASKSYDLQGIVLIDEIETHLHVELQKKILPFLISFFPKIQFVVTTHSPFILNSIENSVICDLEKRIIVSDLSGYSYDTLIESYFDSDNYSSVLKRYVAEYEQLTEAEDLNLEQKVRLSKLKRYLNEIPKFVADELAVKLQQIKLKEISKRRKE